MIASQNFAGFAVILLTTLFVSANPVPADSASAGTTLPAWELAKDKDEIRVFVRPTPDQGREFKGITMVKATLREVWQLLTHDDACHLWRFRCGRLLFLSANEYYIENDLPWPLTDRYALVRRESITDATSGTISIRLVQLSKGQLSAQAKQKLPEHKGLVEMSRYSGMWILTAKKDGLVHISYQMRVDPGGNIPQALANAGATKNPLHTLRKLRELLETTPQRGVPGK